MPRAGAEVVLRFPVSGIGRQAGVNPTPGARLYRRPAAAILSRPKNMRVPTTNPKLPPCPRPALFLQKVLFAKRTQCCSMFSAILKNRTQKRTHFIASKSHIEPETNSIYGLKRKNEPNTNPFLRKYPPGTVSTGTRLRSRLDLAHKS